MVCTATEPVEGSVPDIVIPLPKALAPYPLEVPHPAPSAPPPHHRAHHSRIQIPLRQSIHLGLELRFFLLSVSIRHGREVGAREGDWEIKRRM